MRSYFLLFSFPSCGEEGRGGGDLFCLMVLLKLTKVGFTRQ